MRCFAIAAEKRVENCDSTTAALLTPIAFEAVHRSGAPSRERREPFCPSKTSCASLNPCRSSLAGLCNVALWEAAAQQ